MSPRTLFDKVWDAHVVTQTPGHPAVLYIDLHLVHEVTSPQAFAGLTARGLKLRRPDRTLATMDHSTSTAPPGLRQVPKDAALQLQKLIENCEAHGVELHRQGSPHNGIVHVMGPELGRTLPGMTVVCGDSHTSTHGAFGALAFGIGTSEVEHVMATQCLLQQRATPFEIRIDGKLQPGVTAKDIILAVIAKLGTGGGTGKVFEYTGEAVRALDMEGRMTLCNMSIEAGAKAGMIAPDDVTFAFLKGRPGVPTGAAWDAAVAKWRALATDPGATYGGRLELNVSELAPMITYGTNPGMGIPIDAAVPGPEQAKDPEQVKRALSYMGLEADKPILGQKIDVVFVGSCTNSRMPDLRAAAAVLKGHHVAEGVRMLVVPGSESVKQAAEAEGLDAIFKAAGAEWREPGCSMCLAMNDDRLKPGQYAVSTSNRNFEGRQGPGSRSFLASPMTAAASAIKGEVADPRLLLKEGAEG